MPTTTSAGLSACPATSWWTCATPVTPSGTRCLASTTPASSSTHTSWWASAQSSPTKITCLLSCLLEPGGDPQRTNGSVLGARHPTSRQLSSPTSGGTVFCYGWGRHVGASAHPLVARAQPDARRLGADGSH